MRVRNLWSVSQLVIGMIVLLIAHQASSSIMLIKAASSRLRPEHTKATYRVGTGPLKAS